MLARAFCWAQRQGSTSGGWLAQEWAALCVISVGPECHGGMGAWRQLSASLQQQVEEAGRQQQRRHACGERTALYSQGSSMYVAEAGAVLQRQAQRSCGATAAGGGRPGAGGGCRAGGRCSCDGRQQPQPAGRWLLDASRRRLRGAVWTSRRCLARLCCQCCQTFSLTTLRSPCRSPAPAGKDVVIVGVRRILPPAKHSRMVQRPRTRTLTSVRSLGLLMRGC